ncbi:MAG: aldose 1-epimerase family protein [Bacteriovorax sp.]|nr:aldose 1-epimerase family protein [Bacteriovorax sp.]
MSDNYQIENSFLKLQVTSLGAEIKQLYAKKWQRELIWKPIEENAQKIWKRSSPILFPIVGKLKNDSYGLKGKVYQMPQHGLARDSFFIGGQKNSNEMEFILEADQETFKLYPFCFELRVNYILVEQKLNIVWSVKNIDRQDMYFSIGAHPAFVTEKIEDYEIHFEKKEQGFYQLNNGLVNWKELLLLDSQVIRPSSELFFKDALIFKNIQSKYIDLIETKKNEIIRINGTNTPFLGIWGKESVPFICIEPWYGVSDDAEHDQNLETKNGIQMLPMGESFVFSYSIELIASKG